MNRRAPLVVVALSLVVIALIVGSQLVDNPGFVVPMILQTVLLGSLTVWFVKREPDLTQRLFLWRVIAAGLAFRVAVAGIVYGAVSPYFFAPDTASYEGQGEAIIAYWDGIGPYPEILNSFQKSYAYLNAYSFDFLGDSTWFMVVLNVSAAMWTIVLTYYIARRCFGVYAAKFAAGITSIFPSMVLWSVLNIRDSLTTMLVTSLVFLAVRAHGKIRLLDLVVFAVGVAALSTLRDYMGVLVLAGLALGYLAAARPGRVISTFVIGLAVALGALFAFQQSGLFNPEFLSNPVGQVQSMRTGLQQDFFSGTAGSAFGTDVRITSVGDMARYLPVGLTYFLFAPFPWAIDSILQMTTLPEVLLWYALVPFVIIGTLEARRRQSSMALLVVGVLVLTVCSYALVEGNFGTAYRHRAQIMPLFFVLGGQGLGVWWRNRVEASRRAKQRRSAAKVQLLRSARRR